MKHSRLLPIFAGFILAAAAIPAFGASLRQAAVTEAVNTVSYQAAADAPQRAAGPGTVIQPENIVRTGVDSRAELEFNDKTITRMGANSVFSFDEKSQTMNLRQGSVLFSKPKNNDAFQISTPAATCSITGTTGFIQTLPGKVKTLIFGLIEGETHVTVGGKSYPVGSGELLVSTGGQVRLVAFNINSFLAHAGLFKKFKSTLPNQHEIDRVAAHFANLMRRGFIEPTSFAFAFDHGGLELLVSNLNRQSITQLGTQTQVQAINLQTLANLPHGGSPGGFVSVGSNGIIRGQLVWDVQADLDLHLILPGNAGNVGFNNNPVTFNNGAATATLDADDTGAVNGPGNTRVENIAVSGTPASGTYQLYAQYYSGSTPVNYTLTLTGDGGATHTTQTGTLTTPGGLSGQTSPILTVTH